MPLVQLSERLAQFEKAVPRLDAEQQASENLIGGDRKCILAELDSDGIRQQQNGRGYFDAYLQMADTDLPC